MSCSPAIFRSRDDCSDLNASAQTSASAPDQASPLTRQRRHSSHYLVRRKSLVNQIIDSEDALLLKVDLFLTELERRLEKFEGYGELSLNLDAGILRTLSTLQDVRTRCSQASEGVLGAGRRRVHVMVETLEAGYYEAMAAAGSLNEKAKVGLELLDTMLSDFEAQASKLREKGLAHAAGRVMGEGRRVLDESIGHARDIVDGGIGRAIRAAETLEEHIQRAIARAREGGLLRYDDLPIPWQSNPHIITGYRFSETKLACVRSAFGFSNEVFNIWSHALGFLLVLAVAFYIYPTSATFSVSTTADVLVTAVFFFAACHCLACSAIWHTMSSVADERLVSMFACVDYTGISLLIAASIMTSEYTAFYCEPASRWLYMVTTAVLGIGGTVLPWHPAFNGADMAWARVAFFVALSATGFLPILQIHLSRGPEAVWEFYSPVAKSIFVYFCGACVYAAKVPECWYPGMFDYIGGSHNLWHLAVVGGILFHYTAMHEFFSDAFRRAQGGCPAY